MNRKKGFIATSLIYSFLILFASLIVLILNTYTYYRESLDSYNRNILTSLNNNIEGKYVSLTNLVENSSFENGMNSWIKEGNFNITNYTKNSGNNAGIFTGKSNITDVVIFNRHLAKLKSNSFQCEQNHYYYVSYHTFTTGNISTFFGMGTGIGLYTNGNTHLKSLTRGFTNWKKESSIVRSTVTTTNCNFQVLYNNDSDSVSFFLDDVVVADVTEVINKLPASVNLTRVAQIMDEVATNSSLPYFEGTYSYNVFALQQALS